MDIDPSSTVSASRLVVSLVSWFLLLFGIAIIRLEFAYWLNGILLTVILPLLIWYLGNHSIFLSVSSGTAVITAAAAGLFIIMLTEGIKWKRLKRYLKEFGKDPQDTAIATTIIMVSMAVALVLVYLAQGGDVLARVRF